MKEWSTTSSAKVCVIKLTVQGDEVQAEVHGALPAAQMVFVFDMLHDEARERARRRLPLEGILHPRRMP